MKMLLTIACLAILAACGPQKQVEKAQSIGSVSAAIIKDPAFGYSEAESRAREKIAAQLNTIIMSLKSRYLNSIADVTGGGAVEETKITHATQEFTFARMQGVTIKRRWFDKETNTYNAEASFTFDVKQLARDYADRLKPIIAETLGEKGEEAKKRIDAETEKILSEK